MTAGRRVALVTGGSRGIGRATCLALAAQGAAVAVHYRSQRAAAQAVAAQIGQAGGKAFAVGADLTDPNGILTLLGQVTESLGSVDILVSNAGEMTHYPVLSMTDEAWEQSISLNLTAAFRLTRACLPAMIERRWGRIICLTSQVTDTGSLNHAHYAAAKSGLLGFAYSLAKEVGEAGITVNAISPGRILTDMISDHIATRQAEWLAQTPLRRFGQPEEVASAIAFLASDAASYITGAVLNVNGGLVMG